MTLALILPLKQEDDTDQSLLNQDEAKGCKLSEAAGLKEMCPGQGKGKVPRPG